MEDNLKTFKIITNCTAISEYTLKAESKEQAEELFQDGEYITEDVTDYQDEDIVKIEEVK